jgi:hypothetical protein
MGAHIFLVGADNFEICVQRGVYGCVEPKREWNQAEIIAGIKTIQTGDLVFFYVKNQGVHGVWRIVGSPFYDNTPVWTDKDQMFPYRFCFEAAIGDFPMSVDLNDILDLRDHGWMWTFDLNPVQQKNQYKIMMSEARELIRLLLRNNPIRATPKAIETPYLRPDTATSIKIDFSSSNQPGRIRYEGWLNAWLMDALSQGRFQELFGEYNEFLNLVPTTYNKVMDAFLTHIAKVDGIEVLYKFSCIELKTDRASIEDLTQLLKYEEWIRRRLAAGDPHMVQSVLLARSFAEDVVEYVRKRREIEERTVRLITYMFDISSNAVELSLSDQ